MIRFRASVTDVSDEARELVASGVLILFAEGAPPELAEVSVLHRVSVPPSPQAPPVGARLSIGAFSAPITAVGDYAWRKMGEIGHVVINFNDGAVAPRPGEISAASIDLTALAAALAPGMTIEIEG